MENLLITILLTSIPILLAGLGELVTEKDIEQFKNSDAVLLGAIGHPDVKPGILEQGILLKLRKEFDQYINLRPVVFIREWKLP